MGTPGRRLYIGHISQDARKNEVEDFFSNNGSCKLVDCRVMGGYAFVEYENLPDAEDAVRDLNGRDFLGERISVEYARAPRNMNIEPRERRERPRFTPRGGGHRLTVVGFGDGTSWQDLKDWARVCGNVTYADVSRDRPDEGVIEYPDSRDADEAFKRLDGTELNGGRIKLFEDKNSRRDDRRDYDRRDRDYDRRDDRRGNDRERDHDRRDDRRGSDRGDRDEPRRERRRSPDDREPPPRRRSRSPNPRDRE